MATDSHVKSVTNTLTSTTADEITLTQLWPVVRITNHSTSTWLYARQDGVAVAEADGTTAIAPNTTRAVKGERAEGTNTIVVSVVGDGNTYTVEGVNAANIDIAELEADIAAIVSHPGIPDLSGRYFGPRQTSVTTSTPGQGNVILIPQWVGTTITVDRIGIEVTTAQASAVIRLGIYEDAGGYPGVLVLDAGTVDASTTGFKEATISQALSPGMCWLAMCLQGASGVLVRGGVSAAWEFVGNVTALNVTQFLLQCYRHNATAAGALPDPIVLNVASNDAFTPRILLRVA